MDKRERNGAPGADAAPEGYLEALEDALGLRAAGRFDRAAFSERHPDHAAAVLAELGVLAQLEQPGTGTPRLAAPADAPSPPGRLGAFALTEKIGQGGMGVVYAAQQDGLDRTVAVKILPAGFASTPELRQRFEREAALAARLTHPAIVRIYAFGEEADTLYLAMERIDGASLQTALASMPERTREALDVAVGGVPRDSRTGGIRGYVDAIVQIGIDVADALEAAHQDSLIHRDVKPGNILLDREVRPHLADFGLARENTSVSLTQSGRLLGTPSYLAPECVHGEKATAQADVFALGATLYEALTGVRAFRAETSAEALHRILQYDPPPIDRVDRRLPADLANIVQHAIEKEPAQRYGDAAALRDDLGRFQRGESVTATRVGVLGRWVRRARRRPLTTAVVAGFAALVVIALTTTFFVLRSERIESERQIARLTDRGQALEAAGDLRAAREVFEEVKRLAPDGTTSDAALARIVPILAAERRSRIHDRLLCDFYLYNRPPRLPIEQMAEWVAETDQDRDGLLLRSLLAAKQGRPEEALSWLDRTAAAEDGAALHLLRGHYFKKLGRADAAKREVAEGRRMHPRHIEDYFLQSLHANNNGEFEVGTDLLRRAEERWPDTPVLHYLLGSLADRKSDYVTALRQYDRALQLNPDFPLALARRGLLRLHLKRSAEARADFERACALSPGFSMAVCGLAKLLHQSEPDRARAYELLDGLIAADDKDREAHGMRGELLAQLGKRKEAEESMRRAIRLGNEETVQPYVKLLVACGQREQADAYLSKVMKKTGRWDCRIGHFNTRGWLRWRDPERAAADFRAGLAIARHALLLSNLAVLNTQQGNYAVAEPMYTELIERGYDVGTSLARRGLCRACRLDAERAIEDHERGLERIRENPAKSVAPWMINNYAHALAAAGRYDEAADLKVNAMHKARWRFAAEGMAGVRRVARMFDPDRKGWTIGLVRRWIAIDEGRFQDARPRFTIARAWPRLDIGTALMLGSNPKTPGPLLELAQKLVRGEAKVTDVPTVKGGPSFTTAVLDQVRAELLLRSGRFKKAILLYERIADKLPHPMVYVSLGIAYALDGRESEAADAFEVAHRDRGFPRPFIAEIAYRAGLRRGMAAVDAFFGGDAKGY